MNTVQHRFSRTARASASLFMSVAMLMGGFAGMIPSAQAATAPVGQGFTVTPSDLAFILKQIKIAERHTQTLTAANPCGTLIGPGPDQVPDALT